MGGWWSVIGRIGLRWRIPFPPNCGHHHRGYSRRELGFCGLPRGSPQLSAITTIVVGKHYHSLEATPEARLGAIAKPSLRALQTDKWSQTVVLTYIAPAPSRNFKSDFLKESKRRREWSVSRHKVAFGFRESSASFAEREATMCESQAAIKLAMAAAIQTL